MEPAIAVIMTFLSCNPDVPDVCVALPMEERRYASMEMCQAGLPGRLDLLQRPDNLIRGRCIPAAPAETSIPAPDVIDPVITGSIAPDFRLRGDTANVRVTSHFRDGSAVTREYTVPDAE